MQRATDNIVKHYQNQINGDLQKLHVEEWDMDIYYRHTYSFQDEAKIVELQAKGLVVDALVQSLIVKARDKNGKRIFHDLDKTRLMTEADPAVITRVAGHINNANQRLSMEQAQKE
jgi:hypothetical protein